MTRGQIGYMAMQRALARVDRKYRRRVLWRRAALVVLFAVVGAWLAMGCDEYPAAQGKSRQVRAVEAMGFRNVVEDGTPFIGCGPDDSIFMSEKFHAVGANGPVHGVVCCGLLKGCTVRFE